MGSKHAFEEYPKSVNSFIEQFGSEVKKLFLSDKSIKYNGVLVGEPYCSWPKALSEGLSYSAPLFILYETDKGENKRSVHVFNIPLFTPRKTFVVEGRERLELKMLKPTDVAKEIKKHVSPLSPSEKSRDLRYYVIKEFNFYEFFLKYILKSIRKMAGKELVSYLSNPEHFVGGLDSYLKIFERSVNLFPFLDSTNPLSEVEHFRKISFMRGTKTREGRDIHPTHYGRLCVVETPESVKIGMRLHLAHKAAIKDGRILAPLIKRASSKVIMVGPDEDGLIADSFAVLKNNVLARGGHDGSIVEASKIKYTDAFADQLFGYGALQVPFIQHNDPARALMGAKNLKQATPLKYPDVPIIRTGYEEQVAVLSGRVVKSERKGTVINVTESEIVVKNRDGKDQRYDLIKSIPSVMSKAAFSHIPKVKEGQEVDKDDILAEGYGIKNGTLALGANFLVAYMPYFGYNMDDGIVVSQSVCEKLTSLHIEEYEINKEPGDILVWLVAEGFKLKAQAKNKAHVTPIALLKRTTDRKAEEIAIFPREEMYGGIIRRIFIEPDKIRVWVKKELCLEVGDKLMGRHGNKGVVAKILPRGDMPAFNVKIKGKTLRKSVDIILNPHSVISRMNLGQIFETQLGWIAAEHPLENIRRKASLSGRPFAKIDMSKLHGWFKQSGLDKNGKIKLSLPWGITTANPVVVGYQYIVKLNHLALGKLSVRGSEGSVSFVTEMPLSGKKQGGGQRIGEMEIWALLAHEANKIVREMLGYKANASLLETGAVSLSESLKVLIYYLRGFGVSFDFLDGEDNIIEPEDFEKTNSNRVKKYRVSWADESKMMSWGKHLYVPKKNEFEKLKEYFERKSGETNIRNGAKNILNISDFDSSYKDEMGYIQLMETINLFGKEVKILPVIPVRCRPYAISKINALYKQIFLGNKKMEELVSLGKKDGAEYREKKQSLQKKVGDLLNELEKSVKGKQGVIRKAILGKRVNYSARAVIVPNPNIKADQADVPAEIMEKLQIKVGDKILLNRQPSLHIHNIQAVDALKSSHHAVAINPLVCGGFNADFDGDTIAVYKTEKKTPQNMNVSEQIILSANGKLNLSLSQDIAAGVFYASRSVMGRKKLEELIGDIDIYNQGDKKPVTKDVLNDMVYAYFLKRGDRAETVNLAENLARFGFEWATFSGMTFGLSDLKDLSVPRSKKRNVVRDSKSVENEIKTKLAEHAENPISVMVLSGSRGSLAQIRQMVGVKGGIDRIGGKKTTVGVDSCYFEGLSPTEYYLACYGARNSLGDKKLLTPQCGYLTRRLIFAASDTSISGEDCGTLRGVELELDKTLGRTICDDIPINGRVAWKRNLIVDEKVMAEFKANGVVKIKVRSPLTCESGKGICGKCYGWHLSGRAEPRNGFNVGIMAAEVIGERATQDAMRTYHIGTATGTVTLFDKVKAIFDNAVDPDNKQRTSDGIKNINDLMNLAHTLNNYYENKVDIKHYEVILRTLMIGGAYKGAKGVIGKRNILHQASFERTFEVLKGDADQSKTHPISSIFEKLFI
jgi:hypothetical protein